MIDRVVIVSLRRRIDRVDQFTTRIQETGWPLPYPQIFEAIDGDQVPVPNEWIDGGRAWGCMQSHRQILERAIIDKVESLFVLEDDAWPIDDFGNKLTDFMSRVPIDWDCLMIGGQHFEDIEPIKEGIVKTTNCQRTHAYIVRGNYMRDLYSLWHSYSGHCDHIMFAVQKKYRVYAPSPFLIAQARGKSDITCRLEPLRNWSGDDKTAPIILLHAPAALIPKLRILGMHNGHTLNGQNVDVGIEAVYASNESHTNRVRRLRGWLEMVRREALAFDNGICGIWHPEDSRYEAFRQVCLKAVGPNLVEIRVSTEQEYLEKICLLC